MEEHESPMALVIEDDPLIAMLLARILVLGGFRTTKAGSGAEALAVMADTPPQLITLDLNMPGLSGAALLREIRARSADYTPPVIVVTAMRSVSPEIRANADAIVEKPFEIDEILTAVSRVMPTQQRSRMVGA